MKKNKFYLVLFILSLGVHSLSVAQDFGVNSIANFRKKTIDAETDKDKYQYNDSLRYKVYDFLALENSFNTKLSDIQYLGDLYSPDNEFRIITWNVSLSDGTHDYFCYIQKKPNKDGESTWFELTDHHKTIERPNYKTLKKENWYGCLYYSIIPIKSNKTIIYTLLGWEGNNNYSNKKVIECLSFNSKGAPVFGKSIFEGEKHTYRRVVFEYSKEAYLMLRYNEDSKQIIFNRLEPLKPELEGLYSFYTPSLTYDAYALKKGKWEKVLDINPKNGKTNKEYHDPKKAPKPPKK